MLFLTLFYGFALNYILMNKNKNMKIQNVNRKAVDRETQNFQFVEWSQL